MPLAAAFLYNGHMVRDIEQKLFGFSHHLKYYRENNRIEAKKALGGLPKSLWETYSAFANTSGGVILLGVREERDHSLHPVNLPNPKKLVEEFWQIVNDQRHVSINLLEEKDIQLETVNGNHIIAIYVPEAKRKPVYLENDMWHHTFIRNGEGDYRCNQEEVLALLKSNYRK